MTTDTERKVKWSKGALTARRIAADNGLNILAPNRVSVAVDPPADDDTQWTLRIWGCTDRPPHTSPYQRHYDRQGRAKEVAERFLPRTLDRRFTSWEAGYVLDNIERDLAREDAQRAHDELQAVLATYTPTQYVYGTVTLASGETRRAKRMLLDDGRVLDAVTWYEVGRKMRGASDRIAATWTQED